MKCRLSDPPFANRTGRGVTIAILDSGVHAEHPHLRGATILGGRSFAGESHDVIDRVGHGTAVAAAIHEKAPGAHLIPVKLFHRHLATSAEQLARAIEWAASEHAQVINLSLGTSNAAHAERLVTAVQAAAGSLIVAASETNGTPWYPGSLPNVIGVVADESCERDEIDVHSSTRLLVHSSIYPRPIPDVPRERNLSGISFAVANATGFLARALEDVLERGGPAATTADVVRAFR